MLKAIAISLIFLSASASLQAQTIVTDKATPGYYALINNNNTTAIYVDSNEVTLVRKSASLLQSDIEKVTGITIPVIHNPNESHKNIICIGTKNSGLIQQLQKAPGKLPINIVGKWEAYHIQNLVRPLVNVSNILVIFGSDRRGVAYGVFEFSKQIGISPWYWWADVPVKKRKEIFISCNANITDAPKVKYRGIFINDEAPALSNWSREKFGGFNHKFYSKVFELMLRLKANYIWPAMWGNAFYADDSLNIKMADDHGIVIGTSHHEPLMRAHDEWRRFGNGKWNYDSNAVQLQHFWREGMKRATNEKIVSVGMRGDGDEPMARETATALLEKIVKDQRKIIEDVTGKPAEQTPQLWALYKEVQDYYDKGMRVPDDVTLLLCDDNWGNIRRLPKLNEPKRKGGYGIYYHFDYVGGPRNYKWLNTNNIARVWEQMNLAWEYDARQIWIVNVGDIKPMELPISFFLDHAWNPTKWNETNIDNYYTSWAKQQFGNRYAKEIGDVLRLYGQYSARRKPELLDQTTYNLHNNEFHRVTEEWMKLEVKAAKLNNILSDDAKDAYYQLVLHPVKALTNLHKLYLNVALNHANAKDSNVVANEYAAEAKRYYIKDSLITIEYHQLNGGKWNHMMSQTHIGYTYWQQPPVNKMPALYYLTDGGVTDTLQNPNDKIKSARSLIPNNKKGNSFYEYEGYISINADYWSRSIGSGKIKWKTIPGIGKDGSGISSFPVTESSQLTSESPHVEYDIYCYDTGNARMSLYFSPTLNFLNSQDGLRFAISIDNEQPKIIALNKEDADVRIWNKWVADNIIIKTSAHYFNKPGKHIIKYWLIDPGIVLQKIVADFGELESSYLGPRETRVNR